MKGGFKVQGIILQEGNLVLPSDIAAKPLTTVRGGGGEKKLILRVNNSALLPPKQAFGRSRPHTPKFLSLRPRPFAQSSLHCPLQTRRPSLGPRAVKLPRPAWTGPGQRPAVPGPPLLVPVQHLLKGLVRHLPRSRRVRPSAAAPAQGQARGQ